MMALRRRPVPPPAVRGDSVDDMIREFLVETSENLSRLDNDLVALERTGDPALISNIFRLVHTIKGTCGFLALPRLEKLAHSAENVLGLHRDGTLPVVPKSVTLILKSLDRIKMILAHLEEAEIEPEGSDADLIALLDLIFESKSLDGISDVYGDDMSGETGISLDDDLLSAVPGEDGSALEMSGETSDTTSPTVPSLVEAEPVATPPAPAPLPGTSPSGSDEARLPIKAATKAADTSKSDAKAVDTNKDSDGPSVANQSIRVNVDLLENLMTMVSELVLTRNQLMQILRAQKDSSFAAPLQRLNHVTSELQEGVMKTRMQPIGNAWTKFPRLIRDLSHELGKKIDLVMTGQDTEVDRQVLELIKDPLTHMVRNSADHGVERPAERIAAGKPDVGRVHLSARHEGGHIVVSVTDDGKGLDVDKIRRKIVSNGLLSEAEASALPDHQVRQHIFHAGLSTAEKVTNISGRGVGMDVVKTNIEKIGGTIEIDSAVNKGSTFTIKIPLTLAIISAIVVKCSTETFAIPQINVVELVRAAPDAESRIETINGVPVMRLRNRLLPLVSLARTLNLPVEQDESARETFVIVTTVGSKTFGIMVDQVYDTEEIVVKPVSHLVRHISLFSGNTILGDGSVILILDPNGIAAYVGQQANEHAADEMQAAARRQIKRSDITSLVLFRAGDNTPKAVQLELIARLEDIDMARVEYSSGRPLVQYRGSLMPLATFVPGEVLPETGSRPVLVFTDADRSMGLAVDEIIDIVTEDVVIRSHSETPNVVGSAVISGKVTDIVDVGYYLNTNFHDWFAGGSEPYEEEGEQPKTVMLVDDSSFFRSIIMPALRLNGFEVVSFNSADEAIVYCKQDGSSSEIAAVVSDIEMPGMNGFTFARTLRTDPAWADKPMVALSAHATDRDRQRAFDAGFSDYVTKTDREALVGVLQRLRF